MPRTRATQTKKKPAASGRAAGGKTAITLKALTERAKRVHDLYDVWLDDEEADDDSDSFEAYATQRAALIKQLEPLLDHLAQAGCFDAILSPDLENEGDERRFLRFKPSTGWLDDDGAYSVVGTRPSYVTSPPPDIRGDDEPGIEDPSTFIRIPVTGHAVYEEMWKHEGITTRVIHTRPLLADSTHVEFIDSEFELLSIQPTATDTYAVFGSAADEIDLRYESNDIEELLAQDRALFLGFQHGDIPVDWALRLIAMRSDQSEPDEGTGVFLRGEYRQMPKLDLRDTSEDDEAELGDED
jgi:hypothetical protein